MISVMNFIMILALRYKTKCELLALCKQAVNDADLYYIIGSQSYDISLLTVSHLTNYV